VANAQTYSHIHQFWSIYLNIGYYVGDVYCDCVMYADDLIPVSASVNLLQRMIDTCCEEAVYLMH